MLIMVDYRQVGEINSPKQQTGEQSGDGDKISFHVWVSNLQITDANGSWLHRVKHTGE